MQIGPTYNASLKIIVTGITIQEQGNMAFVSTFDDSVYAYIFGDKIGQIRVSGICFNETCNAGVRTSGFYNVMQQYRNARAANAAISNPLTYITVAGGTYSAFLLAMNLDANDAARNIGAWSYDFAAMPRR